jgi:Fe-S cluster biogenesis protein NfuA
MVAKHPTNDQLAAKPRSLRSAVEDVIDMIRPLARNDGGDIELVDVNDQGVVSIRLRGACVGCPSSQITLSMGIERNLRDRIPEVTRVVCVE